ncbi:hypothetical protein [Pseudonocardia sp.]|uniref:hypothetical protein n=1 Tax=Pseudonocardia sp. TaxID=60912 RepID=UPI0031FBE5F9
MVNKLGTLIRARWYRLPPSDSRAAVLYLHGGGMIPVPARPGARRSRLASEILANRAFLLGIAMGAMGTDVAIGTADVALVGEDLRHLPQALDHARRARAIMLQNVGLSLAISDVSPHQHG